MSLQISPDVTFRLIVDHKRNGRLNMAIDEALMEHAGADKAPAVIRLYGFAPASLSVGRFQRTREVVDFRGVNDAGIDFVRRPSGGLAVLHDQELTYSVALGKHCVSTLSKRHVYMFIVPILLACLESLGIKQLRHVVGKQATGENPDCFAASGEYEINSHAGRKLIGSAQMVSRMAVLQHGSIPLSATNRKVYRYLLNTSDENESSSVSEELGRIITFDEAISHFRDTINMLLHAEISAISDSEMRRAHQLLDSRYNTDEWNQKI